MARYPEAPCSGATRSSLAAAAALMLGAIFALPGTVQAMITCEREVTANVVALDQPVLFNRLGASNVNGMVYALESDVINTGTGLTLNNGGAATPGQVQLRPDKRPRPLVLRVREGDCLTVNFTNLLTPVGNPNNIPNDIGVGPQFNVFIDPQVADRHASFHVSGMQLVDNIQDDGSFVGANVNGGSVVAQGGSTSYHLYAEHEGVFTASSYGATVGSDGNEGNTTNLLFGQVIVEPKGARIYRSGVTEEELRLASMDIDPASDSCGARNLTASGQPVIDYEAPYPAANCDNGTDLGAGVWAAEGKAGLPILNMMNATSPPGTAVEIVHTALDAIVAPRSRWLLAQRVPGHGVPLSAGERWQAQPHRAEPRRAVPRLRLGVPRRDGRGQAFPGFFIPSPTRYLMWCWPASRTPS